MHVYVNHDLFHLAGATTSDPCRGGDDVPKKVRVFGLKHLFLKRFTVRSTTRTLITDKNDHSAFPAIENKTITKQKKLDNVALTN
jgi:hypothetical protein